jgi:hypothetical protein
VNKNVTNPEGGLPSDTRTGCHNTHFIAANYDELSRLSNLVYSEAMLESACHLVVLIGPRYEPRTRRLSLFRNPPNPHMNFLIQSVVFLVRRRCRRDA